MQPSFDDLTRRNSSHESITMRAAFRTMSNEERRRRIHLLLATTTMLIILAVVVVVVQGNFSADVAQQQNRRGVERNLQTMVVAQEPVFSSQVDHQSVAGEIIARRTRRILSSSVTTKAKPCTRHQSIEDLRQRKLLQSQSQQDEHLLQWFNGLCGGTYLEIRAPDDIQFSNSYVFQKAFDWKGLLIGLAPPQKCRKLQRNTPLGHDADVCSPRQAVSGVYEFTSESFRKDWFGRLGGLENRPEGTKEIQCNPLQDLIDEQIVSKQSNDDASVTLIDFFSLNVERGEMAVLHSIDYEQTAFGMILIKADEHNLINNLALRTFVERQGCTFAGEFQQSYWFVHEHYDQIYRHILHTEGET